MEDSRQLAFNLFKAQAIDKEMLIDLVDPPMKELIKDKLKKREEKEARMKAMAPKEKPEKGEKPKLEAIG